METVEIQKAESIDAPRLSDISLSAKKHWNYPEEWLSAWSNELKVTPKYIAAHAVFKLIKQEEIIGFCSIKKDGPRYEVDHLWILPAYMGKGLGKRLLDTALDARCPRGAKIRVYADPNAQEFYEKQGFEKIDQFESYPKGRFLPVLEKTI